MRGIAVQAGDHMHPAGRAQQRQLRQEQHRAHPDRYGHANGLEAFTTRSISCSESDAWGYTAAAAQLDGAAGAYRGDASGTWVYLVFDTPVAA